MKYFFLTFSCLAAFAITAAAQNSKQSTAFIMFLSLCLFLLCSVPSGNPKQTDDWCT